MAKQSFIWTALPNGYTQDRSGLRISVLLSPRLDPGVPPPGSPLSTFFPDWEDWPLTLRRAVFKVSYGGNAVTVRAIQTSGANRVDDSVSLPDSECWRALFRDDLAVRGSSYKDLSNHAVLSYDTRAVAGTVQQLYAKLARSANGDMPRISDVVDDPDWNQLVSAVKNIDYTGMDEKTGLRAPQRDFGRLFPLQREIQAQRIPTAELLNSAHSTFARFRLFQTPPATPKPVTGQKRQDDDRITANWLEYERTKFPSNKDIVEELDFHQVVAAMNSYPTLLRRLGLVVDLIVDKREFAPAADQLLQVTAEFETGALRMLATSASPGTHTRLTATQFQPVPNKNPPPGEPRVADGLLDLDPDWFDVLQMDVDGAGLKLMGYARSLGRVRSAADDPNEDPSLARREDTVTKFERETGAPSLRTAGLMLVQTGRWAMLKRRFLSNNDKNDAAEKVFNNTAGASPPELWAEDVVRGYRIDVWDEKGRWRSLCLRNEHYELNDGEVIVEPSDPQEGTLRLATTKSSDPTSNQNVLYLHEALVSWTGWSLSAPMPGRAIDKNDDVGTGTPQTEPEVPPILKFKSSFRVVPGSLPRLRFGQRYWMRARVVDLAGNSLAPQEKNFGPEKPKDNARPYLRYEPIAAPVIALVKEHVDPKPPGPGESMARMAIRSENDKPALNSVPTDETAHRFAVPPQSSIRDAEHHGKLDAGGVVDPSTFNMLANEKDRDAGDPLAALQDIKIKMKGPLDKTAVETTSAAYNDGQKLTYLPDPLAETVAVRVFDHPNISDSEIIRIPLYPNDGSWPDAQPFKIEVHDDPSAAPSFDDTSATLRVPLPKAIRARVRLSMMPSRKTLAMMGVFQWLTEAEQKKLMRLCLDGQHWMLTPWRTVEVVHAVQKPLITPAISGFLADDRRWAATSVQPRFLATCSLKSTDRMDLLADWNIPDDTSGAIQTDGAHSDVAFSIKITDEKSYARKGPGQPLGGIPEHDIAGVDLIEVNPHKERPQVLRKSHEFHDTRYRRIAYRLHATTKFREFLPTKLLIDVTTDKPTEANITVEGPVTVGWIPSSAPPPTPSVLYVVPTFGWVRTGGGTADRTSWRRGGGLRVYLDRPWNVSGYGEMLAVALPPASFKGDPDELPANGPKEPYRKYITQWGNDPIWLSPFVSGIAPKAPHFPLARTNSDPSGTWLPKDAPSTEADQKPGPFLTTGLQVPSNTSISVDVAPHDVFYDEERQLWYCDIEIDPGGAYFPFIRLALTRYQPTSIGGAYLSNVVLADFMQLTADRWLNVTHTRDPKSRHVVVYGNRYQDSSGRKEASRAPSMSVFNRLTRQVTEIEPAKISGTSVIEITVERLHKEEGEDFGWKPVAGARALPSKARPPKRARKTAASKRRAQQLTVARKFDVLVQQNLIDELFIRKPLWEGDVTLPTDPEPGVRYRLVIAEYEEYLVDDDRPYDNVPTKKDRRLVFVEHVELT